MGDVYRIPAGSTFYIVNTGETQRLHIICSIDPSEGLGFGTFQVHIFLTELYVSFQFKIIVILS